MVIHLKKKKEEIPEFKQEYQAEFSPRKPKIELIPLIEKTDSLQNDLRNLFNLQATKINELIEVVNGA